MRRGFVDFISEPEETKKDTVSAARWEEEEMKLENMDQSTAVDGTEATPTEQEKNELRSSDVTYDKPSEEEVQRIANKKLQKHCDDVTNPNNNVTGASETNWSYSSWFSKKVKHIFCSFKNNTIDQQLVLLICRTSI